MGTGTIHLLIKLNSTFVNKPVGWVKTRGKESSTVEANRVLEWSAWIIFAIIIIFTK